MTYYKEILIFYHILDIIAVSSFIENRNVGKQKAVALTPLIQCDMATITDAT